MSAQAVSARSEGFTFLSFVWRAVFAVVLVFATYNPTRYSYFEWLRSAVSGGTFGPEHALVGIVLLGGWVFFLRATLQSLGTIGLILCAAFFAALVWLLIDQGLLSANSVSTVTWTTLVCLALLLAVGMSWSHIRRRLSGQVDVDDVER